MAIVANQRFGRLVTLTCSTKKRLGRSRIYWQCQCDCGNIILSRQDTLLNGGSQSCGCLRSELTSSRMRRHTKELKESAAYGHWCAMRSRCYSKSAGNYYLYGAKGIIVCGRWRNSFENFVADMGQPPSKKHSLDRFPDKFGNYEPFNCRWATQTEQIRNRSNTVMATIAGVTKPAKEWHELHPIIPYDTFRYRVQHGWNHELALFTPLIPKHLCSSHKRATLT